MAIIDFFLHGLEFLPFGILFIKSKKNHSDSVKNESARAKKQEGDWRQTPPPPACLWLKRSPQLFLVESINTRYSKMYLSCTFFS